MSVCHYAGRRERGEGGRMREDGEGLGRERGEGGRGSAGRG